MIGPKKLDRIRLPGIPNDEWGVTPDSVVELSGEEESQLADHLRRLAFIPPQSAKPPGFNDRQLALARAEGLGAPEL
mgnify:CR=1 FL=1